MADTRAKRVIASCIPFSTTAPASRAVEPGAVAYASVEEGGTVLVAYACVCGYAEAGVDDATVCLE